MVGADATVHVWFLYQILVCVYKSIHRCSRSIPDRLGFYTRNFRLCLKQCTYLAATILYVVPIGYRHDFCMSSKY